MQRVVVVVIGIFAFDDSPSILRVVAEWTDSCATFLLLFVLVRKSTRRTHEMPRQALELRQITLCYIHIYIFVSGMKFPISEGKVKEPGWLL